MATWIIFTVSTHQTGIWEWLTGIGYLGPLVNLSPGSVKVAPAAVQQMITSNAFCVINLCLCLRHISQTPNDKISFTRWLEGSHLKCSSTEYLLYAFFFQERSPLKTVTLIQAIKMPQLIGCDGDWNCFLIRANSREVCATACACTALTASHLIAPKGSFKTWPQK